jgi:opacity protein-like surface antigen
VSVKRLLAAAVSIAAASSPAAVAAETEPAKRTEATCVTAPTPERAVPSDVAEHFAGGNPVVGDGDLWVVWWDPACWDDVPDRP